MADRWLVFDVGCIECGAASSPVGVFPTKGDAYDAAAEYVRGKGGTADDVKHLRYFVGEEHELWIGPAPL